MHILIISFFLNIDNIIWIDLATIFLLTFPLPIFVFHRNHPVILGDNNQNLPRLLGIIGDALFKEAVSSGDEVTKRMVNIVKQIQVNITFSNHPFL